MRKFWLLYIVFFVSAFSASAQQSYAKVILNEQYNANSESSRFTSCMDTSSAVFSFSPVLGNGFYSNTLITLKHDSLGKLFSKQHIKFPDLFELYDCRWYHNKIFVVLTINPQTGSGDPARKVVLLKFSNNLILEKSKILFASNMETNFPSQLIEGRDSTLLLTGHVDDGLSTPGSQFLAQIDFDLEVIQNSVLPNQFRYSYPGYASGNYYWYTYEGRYTLNTNFNVIGTDSLVSSEDSRPSVTGFQQDNQGIRLRILNNVSSESRLNMVRFNNAHLQQKILFSSDYSLRHINLSNDNVELYAPYLNENDSLRLDLLTMVEDSGYTLMQTISLNDTNLINAKPHRQGLGHLLVQHIDSRDTSINFLKGVDSIPAASCLSISYPPDRIIGTSNVVYSFIPKISTAPTLDNSINLLTQPYLVQSIDSLNISGDTTLPAFEFRCTNKSCTVFTPLNGGLVCNHDHLVLRARAVNPFNLDTSEFRTTFIWNDVLEQDTFHVEGFDAQTIQLTGENYFCRQTQNITVDFDSVRVNSRHNGDICLDDPKEVELFVSGYFDAIQWQNPAFDNSTYQVVMRPGSYPFVVESPKGCRINSSVIVPEKCAPKVYIPNAFTPNGDSTNDTFVGYADFTDEFIFRVYDRWGNVIFSTNTSPIIWDGKYKGEPVQVGVYNWRLVYNSIFQGDLFIKDLFGHITVVR